MGCARLAAVVIAAATAVVCPMAIGQDIAAGRVKAAACQTCHGIDGIAKLPDAPHLAAQPAAYLERALRAYRSGERRNEVMSIAARVLSDEDIRDLSAYFAAIRIEVTAVPK